MLCGGPWDPSPRKPFTPLPLFHPSPTKGRRVLGEGVLVPHGEGVLRRSTRYPCVRSWAGRPPNRCLFPRGRLERFPVRSNPCR